ncbi:hypothetical protein AOQ84DRAFT_380642 [Glonium stellatum]|uniref:Uncharacterized protein n=1 Tax=Glonium stellatum TaxID=574774 RepID=A0A8E2ETH6_9PEZI|nr:hypothetical protein AOQ84DRAFT_380642 [Glonium stellatum]
MTCGDLQYVEDCKVLQRDLRRRLVVCSCSSTLDLLPNASIITTTQGLAPSLWRGSVIIYGEPRPSEDRCQMVDINMTDFKHTAEWFSAYKAANSPPEAITSVGPPGKVEGVRINAGYNRPRRYLQKHQGLSVSAAHPLFMNSDPTASMVSRLLRLNIIVARLPYSERQRPMVISGVHRPVSYFMLCCKPAAGGWLSKPFERLEEDNVFVVRKDRKPLLPQHVEALVFFCYTKSKLVVGEFWNLSTDIPESTKRLQAEMTPENFSAFFAEHRALKARDAPEWASVPSPYEV